MPQFEVGFGKAQFQRLFRRGIAQNVLDETAKIRALTVFATTTTLGFDNSQKSGIISMANVCRTLSVHPMHTLSNIAKAVGCSISVVSRSLNPNPDKNSNISESTRERVRNMAKKMGFRPNHAAAFLKRGKTASIGVFLPAFPDSLLASLMMGISEVASNDYFPLSFQFGMTEDNYLGFMQTMTEMSNSGIITYPWFHPQEKARVIESLRRYSAQGGHVILLNTVIEAEGMPPIPGIPTVAIDNIEGGRIAARRLWDRGCTSFMTITGETQCFQERTRGFREVLAERGRDCAVCRCNYAEIDLENLKTQVLAWVAAEKGRLPLGIFAGTDLLALPLLRALRDTSYVVGRDILLVGFDDLDFVKQTDPPLTTIHQPFLEEGRLVMRKLLNMIQGREELSEQVTPWLIARETA